MSDSTPLVLHILASAVSVSNRASQIIKDIRTKGDLGIIDKGENDPQTEADRSAQKCIVHNLQAKFPGLTVIGEEELPDSDEIPQEWIVSHQDEEVLSKKCPPEYHDISLSDVVVWVDPLDGTREFTAGFLDHVTILIGIAVGGRPIAGVINQPYYEKDGVAEGRTVWGMKGVGYSGFRLQEPPKDTLIVTVTRSRSDQLLENVLTKLNPNKIVRVGGAGHKVLLVLEGLVHAYIINGGGGKRWDICASEAILETVGGVLTDSQGNNYIYDKNTSYENSLGLIAVLNKTHYNTLLELFK